MKKSDTCTMVIMILIIVTLSLWEYILPWLKSIVNNLTTWAFILIPTMSIILIRYSIFKAKVHMQAKEIAKELNNHD